jgi:segregation and condensation protein A
MIDQSALPSAQSPISNLPSALADDFTLRLPNYEGPLDVLLRLIEERHLEITAVSLAEVADQFIAYLAALAGRDPNTISNFLAVAARLILLKSRALLPQAVMEAEAEEDDADDLVAQLKAYQLYKRTARWLRARQDSGLRSFAAAPPPVERPRSRQLPLDNVTLETLARAMQRVVDRWTPPPLADDVVSRLPFTVNDCIARIETAAAARARITFREVLIGVDLRVEIIVSLLALLELLKRSVVRAYQDSLFGEIIIEHVPPEERPAVAAE